jgi:hypothetical protein
MLIANRMKARETPVDRQDLVEQGKNCNEPTDFGRPQVCVSRRGCQPTTRGGQKIASGVQVLQT